MGFSFPEMMELSIRLFADYKLKLFSVNVVDVVAILRGLVAFVVIGHKVMYGIGEDRAVER
jgi:hypothetical protein